MVSTRDSDSRRRGSIPLFPTSCARVAQFGLVRRPYKTEIEGSNPSTSTNNKNEGV